MKYNIGDKVRVKSLEWYNKNKNKKGYFKCQGGLHFTSRMSKYCDKIVTIDEIWEGEFYWIQEDDQLFEWTDDMFESDDLEFQRVITKSVDGCLLRVNNKIDIYEETDPTEKLVDDSVEFGKNVMRKRISEYLLKYLPMTPDDKEAFVEEMNKNINSN
jgi:hypothetical protein